MTERLAALAGKYRALHVLRARRDALVASGAGKFDPVELAERGATFRKLARAFPGALRELEVTPTELLARKAALVERALEPTAAQAAPGWMALVADFHAMLREALALKLALTRLPDPLAEETLAQLRARHAAHADSGALVRELDAAWVARLRHPPGGRLLPIVCAALAERHGVPEGDVRGYVFGDPTVTRG